MIIELQRAEEGSHCEPSLFLPAWYGRRVFTSFRTKRLRLLGTGGSFLQAFVPSGYACLEREAAFYKFSFQAAAPAWNGSRLFTSFSSKRLRAIGTISKFLSVSVPSTDGRLELEASFYRFSFQVPPAAWNWKQLFYKHQFQALMSAWNWNRFLQASVPRCSRADGTISKYLQAFVPSGCARVDTTIPIR